MLDELKKLDKPRVENGFGKWWLGCIVDYLGEDWNNISCRGNITDAHVDDHGITLWLEMAWAESPEFRHLLERKFGVKVYHISEEPGLAGYWTNDDTGAVFHTKYFLDTCDMDTEPEYFETIEGVADYLNRYNTLGVQVKPTEEAVCAAIEKYADEHEDEDSFIALNKFEYVDD